MIGLPRPASSAFARTTIRAMRVGGLGASYIPGGRGTLMDLRPFAGNLRASDPKRYARNAEIVATDPVLRPWLPDHRLDRRGPRSDAGICRGRLSEKDPGANADRDPRPGSHRQHGGERHIRQPVGRRLYLVIADAKHELLMEQNHYRAQFWSAFDSFAA